MLMNIETVKTALTTQFETMCNEFIQTMTNPAVDHNVLIKQSFCAGRCAGALQLLKQVLTEDEYEQLNDIIDSL